MAVARRNAGSALLTKPARVEQIVRSVSSVLSCPLTIKVGLDSDRFNSVFAAVQNYCIEHDMCNMSSPPTEIQRRCLACCKLTGHYMRCFSSWLLLIESCLWSRCARGTTTAPTLCTSGCRTPRAGAPPLPQSMGARASRGEMSFICHQHATSSAPMWQLYELHRHETMPHGRESVS